MSVHKSYLGDSVYADCDGFAVILTTENDDCGPSNIIYLEPEVIAALNRYVERLKQMTTQPLPAPPAEQKENL